MVGSSSESRITHTVTEAIAGGEIPTAGAGWMRLPATRAAIEDGVRRRLHLGAQLYVSRHDETVADAALGHDRPGAPLTPEHRMLWLSATKPVTAVAVAQLWERGLLALDDPIARHLPEFAQGGKEAITVRHALTHTGGFRMVEVGWPEKGWKEILQGICERRREPRWVPGEKAGYHLTSSWFILGELIQRLDGRPFSRYVREAVFEPLGASECSIGMPEAEYQEARDAGRIAHGWNTETWPAGAQEPPAHRWHRQAWVTRPSPGGNGRGPMAQLGRFYEALLAGGAPLLAPQTVEALTARHRTGMRDHTFQHVMDWGLGFIVDSNLWGADTVPYGYGPHSSRRTYGHSGYRSVAAFADPAHGLAVALAFNGTPSHEDHEARIRQVLGALYRDLDLTDSTDGTHP